MVYELYNEKLLYLYKLAREIFGINLFGMIFFFFYVYLNMNINYNWKNVEKLVHDPILLLFSLFFFFLYPFYYHSSQRPSSPFQNFYRS